MVYEIRFTPEAEDTYDSVVAQLMERWGEKFVLAFEKRLEKALNTLTRSPFICPIIVESTQIRRCLLHRNCSLLYRVVNDIVIVVCFWDNRQDVIFS